MCACNWLVSFLSPITSAWGQLLCHARLCFCNLEKNESMYNIYLVGLPHDSMDDIPTALNLMHARGLTFIGGINKPICVILQTQDLFLC